MSSINQLNASTPTNSQKLCLETSFTSLQSPGEPIPIICSSSKASSMAGSLFSRSQLNSILHYDGNSIHDDSLWGRSMSAGASEATTVLLADPITGSYSCRGKSVAFDISKSSYPSTTSPSPNVLPKSILHRQTTGGTMKKPATLSFTEPGQESSFPAHRKIDFAHDDWYGMAPLASPETLSEISSISSRTSLALNLASSIEKYLHRVVSFNNHDNYDTKPNNELKQNDFGIGADVQESEMSTPKVMRRTPKIPGNLSTCADDWRSVDKYKRMGRVFITNPVPFHPNSDSSEQSFESTFSLTNLKGFATVESSKSNDNFDDSSSSDDINSIQKLTMNDSALLNECISTCPRCPCKFTRSSSAVKCCRKYEHGTCIDAIREPSLQTNTSSTSDTYHSTMSSMIAFDPNHFNSNNFHSQRNDNSTVFPSGLLESHFPVYMENTANESTSLLPTSTNTKAPNVIAKSNIDAKHGGFRRVNDNENDRYFTRNESLPLLAGLVEKSSPSSFVRRKNYVYPMTSSPKQSPSKKGESSV